MEPSPVPYNLRSRGRVVGTRLLRRRGVQEDNRSGKHYYRRRPKPSKPFVGTIVRKDPLEVERIKKFLIERRLRYHKRFYPYPFLAMRHYNKNLNEGDQYKVSQVVGYANRYYRKVGVVQLMYFKAQPKSLKNLPNSSDDVSTKHFLARAHQMPNGETHVSDCRLSSDPPSTRTLISNTLPIHCGVCQLENEAAFKSKSRKLREEAKAQNLSEDDDPKAFFPKSYYDYGFSDSD